MREAIICKAPSTIGFSKIAQNGLGKKDICYNNLQYLCENTNSNSNK